jgi:hypothetical protein
LLTCATLLGCDHTGSFTPDDGPPVVTAAAVLASDDTAPQAVAFAGGIPFGTFGQPLDAFGDRYNGAQRNIAPGELVNSLTTIRNRGGKVVLTFVGNNQYYKDSDGHFSFSRWQARVDRFRAVDFSSFIDDGTVIAHYLLDEPNDPTNWAGQPVSGATVEAMAEYSKQIWPTLATVVRVDPGYLADFNVDYQSLDAAWAQYVERKGPVDSYIQRHVADAQALGLQLIVGLNLYGALGNVALTANEVEEWGSVLLNSPYPCAFISWYHNSSYLAGAGIGQAMDLLRSRAQNRNSKTCRRPGSAPAPTPPPPPPPPPSPSSVAITWPRPQDISYGTPLGPAQLNAVASSGGQSVPGSYSYQPAAGTVLNAGQAQPLRVTFTPSDPTSYEGASAAVNLDVDPVAPSLTWTVPPSIQVGPLPSGVLDATASGIGGETVSGSFTYTPAAGQVLDASPSRTLSVTFQPSGGNYTSASKSLSLAVLYPWSGFFQPVDNPGRLNTAKAGVAIRVKFGLGGNQPGPVLASGSPEVSSVPCPSWPSDAIEQTVSASSSSLRYDAASGRYIYTWKTSTSWANSCRKLTLVLKDGTSHEATFRFSR